MSLTSYRAAPPRVMFRHIWALPARFSTIWVPDEASLLRDARSTKLTAFAKSRGSYEPDELPGCSTLRHRRLAAGTGI
jgi:hypothetical protein